MFATLVLDGSVPQPIPSASLEEALMIQDSLLEMARRPGSPSHQRVLGAQALVPGFTGQVLVVKVPNVDGPRALQAAIAAGTPVVAVVGKPILPAAEIPPPVAGHAA
jgi:hypothetical protein